MAESVFGPWTHLIFSSILFLASVILVVTSHAYDVERRLDFVTLYDYQKAIPDKGKAIASIESALRKNSWLNAADDADTKGCLDMSRFGYPTVSFKEGEDPTSPTCQISFSVKQGPGDKQVQFEAIYAGVMIDCAPGVYTLSVKGGAGLSTSSPKLTIVGGSGITNSSGPSLELSVIGSFGYDYASYNTDDYKKCRDARQSLADAILFNTACDHSVSSPMCACIQTFTSRLTAWNGKLKGILTPTLNMDDVLINGVSRCVELRRTHDIRKPVEKSYARSSALLIFCVALFFNSLYTAFLPWMGSMWLHVLTMAIYFAGVILTGLLDADKGQSTAQIGTILAIVFPAFFVIGVYGLILRFSQGVDEGKLPLAAPFLHPVTFDLCLCALTLFTLVERGVVQTEYLVVEVFKCHAVAAIYVAVSWYHRHGSSGSPGASIFASESVQQAYLTIVLVGLGSTLAPVVVPYPAKKCFELHWLLPFAFAYLAFSNPSWAHSLQMPQKLAGGGTLVAFNEVAGLFALLFGAGLWAYFLQDHLQVYGASHFPYAAIRDPLAPVTLRMI